MNRREFLQSTAVMAGAVGASGVTVDVSAQPRPRFSPSHFASPAGAGTHNGTPGNEWTLAEAYAEAVAGNRVQFAPGTYHAFSGPVRTQALTPKHSGTASAPIVFFAQYPAVHHLANPERHSAWVADFDVHGLGSVTGHAERTPGGRYVVWDGLSMRQANGAWNSGELAVVSLFGGEDLQVKFLRCLFDQRGEGQLEPQMNWGAVFIQSTTGIEFADCIFQNIPGSKGDENAMPLVAYGTGELEVHHCEFRDNNGGSIWLKGQPGGSTHDNRPVRLHHCLHTGYTGLSLGFGAVGQGNLQDGQFVDLFQNIWHPARGGLGATINWRDLSGGSAPRNVRMVNNTIVGDLPFSGGEEAFHQVQTISDSDDIWRDCVFSNNIVDVGDSNAAYIYVQYGTRTAAAFRKMRIDHNCYAKGFGDYAGMSFGGWRKLGQDVNSLVGDPRFRNKGDGDFRLTDTSRVRAAGPSPGVDILNLRGQGATAPINMGAYITDDMSDTIGVRPESVTQVAPIVWSWPYAR